MKQIISFFLIALFFILHKSAFGAEASIAGNSATLLKNNVYATEVEELCSDHNDASTSESILAQRLVTIQELVSKESSSCLDSKLAKKLLIKRKAIYNVLAKYNSPLTSEVDSFISACKKYDLDCYLLPSITGIESYFGQMIYPGTYNGFGWGGGMIYFDNWEDSIMTVGKGLRENYFNRGAISIYDIGRIYAPPSTTWPSKVTYFMNQFYAEETRLTETNLPL
ncbi:MAG TPA: hypothetical protein VK338_00885 [Candidatus Nitrosocosmicus sp.]|nr:hypothetical protein [Candidatus Nitrosocosmicus sp.]